MARPPTLPTVSGGREADLISINCEGPGGLLGPHVFFWVLCPRGPTGGPPHSHSQVHTLSVK